MSEKITIEFESDLDKADFITRFGHLLHTTYRYECQIQKVAETPAPVKVDHALLKVENTQPKEKAPYAKKMCSECGNYFTPGSGAAKVCNDCKRVKAEQPKKAQSQQ